MLREIRIEDSLHFSDLKGNEEYFKFQAIEPTDWDNPKEHIQGYLDHRGEEPNRRIYVFSAIEIITENIIGQIGLTKHHNPQIASIGFGILPANQSLGYATEMAKRIIQYGFEDLNLHRIEADVAIKHEACFRVMKKLNMTNEGTLRESIWAQGRWWTEAKFSILEHEYK